MTDAILFFGCWELPGHYIWGPRRSPGRAWPLPLSLQSYRLDGRFAPKDPVQHEGRACLHHVDGWTVVAWWDRHGDDRMGSNSALLMRGTHTFPAVMSAAREHFPELLSRFASLELTPS